MHSSTVIDCIQRLLYLSQIMCIQIEVIICIEGTTVLSAWSWCSNEQLHPISSNRESERYHSITPKAVTLALTSRQLNVSARERVLPDALHSIRSLLCTSTNAAPHEIFRLGPTISKPHGFAHMPDGSRQSVSVASFVLLRISHLSMRLTTKILPTFLTSPNNPETPLHSDEQTVAELHQRTQLAACVTARLIFIKANLVPSSV